MSDVCDRADGVAAVVARGGRFVSRGGAPEPRGRPVCGCGGRPGYAAHPPLVRGGDWLETLACPRCGRRTGPFKGRQQLDEAWRLGMWEG